MEITKEEAQRAAEKKFPAPTEWSQGSWPTVRSNRRVYAKVILNLAPFLQHQVNCHYRQSVIGGYDELSPCSCGLDKILSL